MTKRIFIKGLCIHFTFRHKWDTVKTRIYPKYELGIWFRKSKIVGSKGFSNPKTWKSVNNYTFGVKLLICQFWIDIDYKGQH